jgi:NitT/TauT family transport system ATP-binding protein
MASRPGRIVEEFRIDLPRPRNVNDASLVGHAARITAALKEHMSTDAAA